MNGSSAFCDESQESSGCIPGHTGILGTLPLTETTVSTNSSGGGQGTSTGTRVHGDGLADDEAIGNELADGLAGVGVGDLVDFIGIQPDLALSASDNGRRKALLRAEIDPVEDSLSASMQTKGLKPLGRVFVKRGCSNAQLATEAAGSESFISGSVEWAVLEARECRQSGFLTFWMRWSSGRWVLMSWSPPQEFDVKMRCGSVDVFA